MLCLLLLFGSWFSCVWKIWFHTITSIACGCDTWTSKEINRKRACSVEINRCFISQYSSLSKGGEEPSTIVVVLFLDIVASCPYLLVGERLKEMSCNRNGTMKGDEKRNSNGFKSGTTFKPGYTRK